MRWSAHAEKKLKHREVDRLEAERTIDHQDDIVPGQAPRSIYQRRYFDAMLGEEMLLRVVIEETATERVVVTLYKSSKPDRYVRG